MSSPRSTPAVKFVSGSCWRSVLIYVRIWKHPCDDLYLMPPWEIPGKVGEFDYWRVATLFIVGCRCYVHCLVWCCSCRWKVRNFSEAYIIRPVTLAVRRSQVKKIWVSEVNLIVVGTQVGLLCHSIQHPEIWGIPQISQCHCHHP